MTDTAGATGRQLAYLEQLVRAELVERRRRRDWDRRRAFTLQLATVTLSALITVLLGVKVSTGAEQWLANVALALGALVTVLAAWATFFSYRTVWIQRADTVHRLTTLARSIDYLRAGLGEEPPAAEDVDRVHAEFEEIARGDHEAWIRIRQAEGA
ncbi:DUF4231 domain-containing protein [Kitasatospora sp. NPDC048365]|uniref:DUF4231 domain-containing protein n=1 Tax=Kitasatospora sp. NPDC048365 TaxID=3364050 RepID=UPI00371A7B96